MKKLLVFQHVPHEILGTLNPLFKDAGFRIHYINFGRDPHQQPTLDNADGLVVLGGPMGVYEGDQYPHIATEIRLIQQAVEKKIPVLGICLGSQLIAKALGAEVRKNSEKEIGWYDLSISEAGKQDRLFKHFHPTEKVFQWHGDTFDIPPGAVHLASSSACANQAFRYGDHVYGLQFHLEVDEQLALHWLTVPQNQHELAALTGKINHETIKLETPLYVERLKKLSQAVFGEFIDLFGPVKRDHLLFPSR